MLYRYIIFCIFHQTGETFLHSWLCHSVTSTIIMMDYPVVHSHFSLSPSLRKRTEGTRFSAFAAFIGMGRVCIIQCLIYGSQSDVILLSSSGELVVYPEAPALWLVKHLHFPELWLAEHPWASWSDSISHSLLLLYAGTQTFVKFGVCIRMYSQLNCGCLRVTAPLL